MAQTFCLLRSLLEYLWESLVCVYFSHITCQAVLYLLICFSLRLPVSRGPQPCLIHPDTLPWDIIPRFFCNVWKWKWGVGLGYSGSENKLLCGWSLEMTNVLQSMGPSSTRISQRFISPRGFPGSPVVKTLSAYCRGPGSIPGQGTRSSKDPVCHNKDTVQPNK